MDHFPIREHSDLQKIKFQSPSSAKILNTVMSTDKILSKRRTNTEPILSLSESILLNEGPVSTLAW